MFDLPPQDFNTIYYQEKKIDLTETFQKGIPFSCASFSFTDIFGKRIAGIVKIPSKKIYDKWEDLPCPEIDRQKIIEIITKLGTIGKIELLLHHKSHLEKIGDEVRYIHPLKFLAVIFSDPQLKSYMKVVYDDYFKWKNFIEGLSATIDKEVIKNNLDKYLDNFSKEIRLPVYKIKPYINKRDWPGLLKCLIFTPY